MPEKERKLRDAIQAILESEEDNLSDGFGYYCKREGYQNVMNRIVTAIITEIKNYV